ncbi:hypothetical protein ABC977_14435 [Thioalkalicoccus limnaeus]|uniref:Uncharacterized protein n=1 Tax=Thioalkalicoccus limnaeus TaxID=120681 RepID=A0ABV4BMA3_9GAMM
MSERDEDKKRIENYFNKAKEIISEIKRIRSKRKIGAIVISDAIILSVPFGLDSPENYSNLRQLCIAIQKIQFGLSLEGIWLRGAISFGNAYINNDESQIVGPAYVNAYLLEQISATHPRVILDSKLIGKLGFSSAQELITKINNTHDAQEYRPETSNILYEWYHNGTLKHGLEKDIPLFIDYMVYCFVQEGALTRIVSSVEASMYANSDIYLKYRWVVDYLISSCIHHNNHILLIDSTALHEQLGKLKNL